jgi:hypothetical protein
MKDAYALMDTLKMRTEVAFYVKIVLKNLSVKIIRHSRLRNQFIFSDVCFLPRDHGPCKRMGEPKWGYDPDEGRCVEFLWACQGNANRFDTEEECNAYCCKSNF